MDLTLYKLQWLICHKTKPNQIQKLLLGHFSLLVLINGKIISDPVWER